MWIVLTGRSVVFFMQSVDWGIFWWSPTLSVVDESIEWLSYWLINYLYSATASCTCQGDPHCKTFDGVRYDYQGTCKYNLASVKTQTPGAPFFQVFSRSEHRRGRTQVSFVKYAEIIFGGDTVRLVNDQFSRDAVPVISLVSNLFVLLVSINCPTSWWFSGEFEGSVPPFSDFRERVHLVWHAVITGEHFTTYNFVTLLNSQPMLHYITAAGFRSTAIY